MEKARKRVRFCLVFVVLAAVVVGILYYYGQMLEEAPGDGGTLISNVQLGIKRLWR